MDINYNKKTVYIEKTKILEAWPFKEAQNS